MLIYTQGHKIHNPLMEIVHAMTGEKALITDDPEQAAVHSAMHYPVVTTTIHHDGACYSEEYIHEPITWRDEAQSMQDAAKIGYYRLAARLYQKSLPWGCLTGIRPAKIAAHYLNADQEEGLMRDFFISREKAALALSVARRQKMLAPDVHAEKYGIYIGIPFCPTRCLYCSFVSLPMDKQKKYVQPYVDRLCEEIRITGDILKNAGKTAGLIYIGGGTPTSINEQQLAALLEAVQTHLGIGDEFTVEAGRPDTITQGKLKIMKAAGVSRISINPQTLNDSVLETIGRKHTAQQFFEAFEAARKAGFDHINTDVIAGLPGEDYDSFVSSLDQLIALSPESVTVHTMCVKRAAALKGSMQQGTSFSPAKMVQTANEMLETAGLYPYYMYRQKDTLDLLENTGYAKENNACLYNIYMMEDMGGVIGLGAGAVTKIIDQKSNRIERIFNLKDAYEYVKRFDETIRRKEKLQTMIQK